MRLRRRTGAPADDTPAALRSGAFDECTENGRNGKSSDPAYSPSGVSVGQPPLSCGQNDVWFELRG